MALQDPKGRGQTTIVASRPSRPRPRPQRSRSQSRPARRRLSFASTIFTLNLLPRMPPLFNIIRTCLLLTILTWTIVCLAIAVHFQGMLIASDLTRFIPFAIFVCSATLLVALVLLGFGLRKGWNPISVRIELGCLGLIGTFWLALGTFLASSDSQDASVECFASDSDTEVVDVAGFSTDTYHAQYHVLEAFSLFNVILIWGFMLLLLGLSLREHFLRGRKEIWMRSVTAYSWFGKRLPPRSKHLPPPVTARVGRSNSRGVSYGKEKSGELKREYSEKRETSRAPGVSRGHSQSRPAAAGDRPTRVTYSPPKPPPAHTKDSYRKASMPRR